ncbi:MAG: hypothetical protein R6U43_09950 [Candidatus Krumholzibacteriales bacterium]
MSSRVIIIGAGASYGHGVKGASQPPLGTGFFEGPIAKEILTDYSDFFGYLSSTLYLEDLSEIDIEELAETVQGSWELSVYDRQEIEAQFGISFCAGGPKMMLRGYIVDHVWLSTKWLSNASCPFHEELFKKMLSPNDAVISFNYDLIADVALKKLGLWSESSGYFGNQCFVRLLKPHGSLNWFKNSSDGSNRIEIAWLEDALRGARNSDDCDRTIIGVIPKIGAALDRDDHAIGFAEAAAIEPSYCLPLAVLPTSKKDFIELTFGQLATVWKQMKQIIKEASEVIAVGFSFRDRHFNQLLLESIKQRTEPLKLKLVCPSKVSEPGERLLSVPKLDVIRFKCTLEKYVESLE